METKILNNMIQMQQMQIEMLHEQLQDLKNEIELLKRRK